MENSTLLSEIANPRIPQIMTPAQGLSLQDMATKVQANKIALQSEIQEMQKKQKLDAYMQNLTKRGSEVRDPATGVWTPKGILEISQGGYWELADKAAQARAQALHLSAEQLRQERTAAVEEFKGQGMAIEKLLQGSYASYATDTAKDPETKQLNFRTAWQKNVQEWIDSGIPKRLGFTEERLMQLRNNPPNPDTIPLTLGKTKEMLDRADAFKVGQSLSGDQTPTTQGVPLSNVGGQSKTEQAPSAMETSPGTTPVTIKMTTPDTVEAKPIAENEMAPTEVTAKAPESTPDSMRAQATKLEKQGTPGALKYAKELRNGANQLEQRIQKGESLDLSKAREARIKAAGDTNGLREEDATFIADQVLNGNAQAGVGLARNIKAKTQVIKAITDRAKAKGISPQQANAAVLEFAGIRAAQTTAGHREATVSMAVTEAQNLIPVTLAASAAVTRTKYPALNSILLAAEKGTGDEAVVNFGIAVNSFINVYARAISPVGAPTVSDKDHAREVLAANWSKGQFESGMMQLNKEMEAAKRSPRQVRDQLSRSVTGEPEPKAGSAKDYSGLWK